MLSKELRISKKEYLEERKNILEEMVAMVDQYNYRTGSWKETIYEYLQTLGKSSVTLKNIIENMD